MLIGIVYLYAIFLFPIYKREDVIICIARASREHFLRFDILFSILLQFESSVVIVLSWSKVFLSFLTPFASFLILQI